MVPVSFIIAHVALARHFDNDVAQIRNLACDLLAKSRKVGMYSDGYSQGHPARSAPPELMREGYFQIVDLGHVAWERVGSRGGKSDFL